MRQITDHQVNECNDKIRIHVADEPGEGGASHEYVVEAVAGTRQIFEQRLSFQNGPIKEKGTNGITQEVLIAICIDRLRGFQSGEFACRENALALTKLEEAQMWLNKRTRDRDARGVEGTHIA